MHDDFVSNLIFLLQLAASSYPLSVLMGIVMARVESILNETDLLFWRWPGQTVCSVSFLPSQDYPGRPCLASEIRSAWVGMAID